MFREMGWFLLFLAVGTTAWIPAFVAGKPPSETFIWDPWGVIYTGPYAQVAGRMWLEGYFPLWNPHLEAGAPLLGNIQTAALFPIHVLQSILPEFMLEVVLLAKFALAGYFMNLFMRRGLNSGVFAAFFAGVVFMLSGRFAEYVNTQIIHAEMMLPLVFLVMKKIAEEPCLKSFSAIVYIFCLLSIAGQPESAVYFSIAGFLYYLTLTGTRSGLSGIFSGRLLIPVIGGFSGVILASAGVIPFLEYFALGWNHHFDLIGKAHYEAAHLPGIIFPGLNMLYVSEFFARLPVELPVPVEQGMAALLKLPGYVRYSVPIPFNYAGTAACLGAILALLNLKRLNPDASFFAGMMLIVLGILYGLPSFNNILALPVLNHMSNFRFLPPLALFSMAVLCGLVLDLKDKSLISARKVIIASGLILLVLITGYLTHRDVDLPKRISGYILPLLYTSMAFLGILSLLFWRKKSGSIVWKSLTLAVTFAELIVWQRVALFSPFKHPKNTAPPSLISAINDEISSYDNPVRFHATEGVFTPDLASSHKLYDVRNTDALLPKRYTALMAATAGISDLDAKAQFYFKPAFYLDKNNKDAITWDIMAAGIFILKPGNLGYEPTNKILRIDDRFEIIGNRGAMPYAWAVPKFRNATSSQDALNMVFSENFDPKTEVILEGMSIPHKTTNLQKLSGTPAVKSHTAQKVLIDTSGSRGFLVVADEYYPGWKALTQGKERRIYPANSAFRGIELKPEDREITIQYEPVSFKLGLWASISSFASIIGIAIRASGRKKR